MCAYHLHRMGAHQLFCATVTNRSSPAWQSVLISLQVCIRLVFVSCISFSQSDCTITRQPPNLISQNLNGFMAANFLPGLSTWFGLNQLQGKL